MGYFALPQGIGSRHSAVVAAGALIVALTGWLVYEVALTAAIADAGDGAQRRLALFDRSLEAIIERYHYLPVAISQAKEARTALENPGDHGAVEAAN
ncbi:MAG TPA: hypothetical protein VL133_17575, partial [Devosia sp.]|nr:hypothetical protein [Devosia sp.]